MIAIASPRRLTGRAVLVMLLAFFGVVAGVNALFVVAAVRSFSGLSADAPYRRGLDWNRELEAAEVQRAQGWRAEVEAIRSGGDEVQVRARFSDVGGRTLDGLVVRAQLRRPVERGHDATAELAPQGPGDYGAALSLPLRGQWDLRLEAIGPDGARHVQELRLWLP